MTSRLSMVLAYLVLACATDPAFAQAAYNPGDAFYILRDVEAVELNGSSSDRDVLVERVIRVSQAGSEIEYDLPGNTSAEDRTRQWQLPARVLKGESGSLQLLNRPELEKRLEVWLKAAGLTAASCGHYYFTWNVFKIDCDPNSAIETIKSFDLGPDQLAAGSRYRDSQAIGPALLRPKNVGTILVGDADIDPNVIRRARAQSDLVTAEIMRKPITADAAARAHALERISGRVTVEFQIDARGRPKKQTTVRTIEIKGSGKVEKRTVTQTIERRPISEPGI